MNGKLASKTPNYFSKKNLLILEVISKKLTKTASKMLVRLAKYYYECGKCYRTRIKLK